jgi:cell wall-associated NlpC family hydrolase
VSYGSYTGYAQIAGMSARSHDTYDSGDSGSDVKALNQQLLALGYYDAVPGNAFDSATVAAVKRLRAELGLTESGDADITLMRVLKESGDVPASPLLSASLASGSKGDDVKRVQTRLYALGYLARTASIDSDFGTTTANAVKLFQKAEGLSQTGKADTATIRKLYGANAASLPSGTNPADQQSSANDDPGSTDNSALSAAGQAKVEVIIEYGKSKLGCKYVYGAEGPTTFDCSGFTQTAFKQAGVSLSRSAYSVGYGSAGTKIAYSGLVRGDIVCFNTISDSDLSDHVGIYLGSGKFIHASSGKGEVVISDMSSGYYNRVFSWGKRFIN